MSIDPDKCSRCGAPINWSKISLITRCDFCGKPTSSTSRYLAGITNNFFRINHSILNILSPINNKLKSQGAIILDRQNILSDTQVRFISDKLRDFLGKKSNIFLLVGMPIVVIILTIANDPIRPYKKEVEKLCRSYSSMEDYEFSGKRGYKKCSKKWEKIVRDKIKEANDKDKAIYYPTFGVWIKPDRLRTKKSNIYDNPYVYSNRSQAEAEAERLGCKGAHKMGKMWLPCSPFKRDK